MAKSCSPTKRRDMDIMKLMMSDYEVEHLEGGGADFCVTFNGPQDTPYEEGVWKVRVELPIDYPYQSPSVGFMNRLYHPNVDETSGSVCLDVINQTWSPMFDLVNIFDVFLPQLLRYPNPSDPLNAEAASLMLEKPKTYAQKVKDMVAKHASKQTITEKADCEDEDMDVDDLSSLSGASECDLGDFDME